MVEKTRAAHPRQFFSAYQTGTDMHITREHTTKALTSPRARLLRNYGTNFEVPHGKCKHCSLAAKYESRTRNIVASTSLRAGGETEGHVDGRTDGHMMRQYDNTLRYKVVVVKWKQPRLVTHWLALKTVLVNRLCSSAKLQPTIKV